MPSFRLGDLVDIIVEKYASKEKKIKIIGLRPGEKMHEELMIEGESLHSYETDDLLILQNAICTPYHVEYTTHSYASAKKLNGGNCHISNGSDIMSKEKLATFLVEKKIID